MIRTMADIQARASEIDDRLAAILDELRNASKPKERAIELAEEIALLLREQNTLQFNVRHHVMIMQQLMGMTCSGPH